MRSLLRALALLLALPLALLAAACGGGGGSGGSSGGTAALAGTVLTRDGTTDSLGGLRLRLGNTGEIVTTRSDGSFDFGSVPTGTVTVELVDPVLAVAGTAEEEDEDGDEQEGEEEDADEGDDEDDDDDVDDDDGDDGDDGDDDDTGDDDFDVEDLEDGEHVSVKIEVEGGVIVSVQISRSKEERLRVDVELERSVESDDPDVEGHVRIESRDDREVLKAEAEELDPGREVELFVIDPDGNEVSLGVRTAGEDEDDEGDDEDGDEDEDTDDGDEDDEEDGEAEWKLDTRKGDELPFGVASVEDLLGYRVEVRDAADGTVLLFGTIPELPDPLVEFGGDDDDDEQHGRAALAAEAGVEGEAFVEIERETEDDGTEEELEFEAEHLALAAGTVLEVFLEDSGGTLVSIGTMTVDAEGEAELELETDDGGSLPLGAASLDELVGRRVEIRLASDGTLLFSGEVPPFVNP